MTHSWDWSKVRVRELRQGRRQKAGEPFAMLTLTWAAKAAAATSTPKALVWIWLMHRSHKTRSKVVAVPNGALAQWSVSRYAKRRALQQLEVAGLIRVERRDRKTPVVRLL
jgi:hypothetical protein